MSGVSNNPFFTAGNQLSAGRGYYDKHEYERAQMANQIAFMRAQMTNMPTIKLAQGPEEVIRTMWSWLRLYGAAIQLEAAKKLLEVEQAMGADIEHILRAQARVNERRQAHIAIQVECGVCASMTR